MKSDIGDDGGAPSRLARQRGDNLRAAVDLPHIGQGGIFPVGFLFFVDEGKQFGKREGGVADDGVRRKHILVDFGAVGVELQHGYAAFFERAERPVSAVEPRAYGDEQVALAYGGGGQSVDRGQHAEEFVGIGVETPQPHICDRHGTAQSGGKLRHLVRRARRAHSAADVKHGLFRRVQHLRRPCDFVVERGAGRGTDGSLAGVFGIFVEHIGGDVHQHGPASAAFGKGKRPSHGGGDFARALDDHSVFGHGHRHIEYVHFLKTVVAEFVEGDIARDGDEGHGIHISVGNARHEIGRAGARGRQHHTRLAAAPRVTFRGETRALLVRGKHMLYRRSGEGVVDGENTRAGIAEYVENALLGKAIHEYLRSAQQHLFLSCPRAASRVCGRVRSPFIIVQFYSEPRRSVNRNSCRTVSEPV